MDSDNELLITQSKASNDLEIGSSEFDPEFLLNKIAEGALEKSEMSHSKNVRNNPSGIDFSDISDEELLITARGREKNEWRTFWSASDRSRGISKIEKKASIFIDIPVSGNGFTIIYHCFNKQKCFKQFCK